MRDHDDPGMVCPEGDAWPESSDPAFVAPIQWAVLNADPACGRDAFAAMNRAIGTQMSFTGLPYQPVAEAEYFDATMYLRALLNAARKLGNDMTPAEACEVLVRHFERRQETLHNAFCV